MVVMAFKDELRTWRGTLLQKEAADRLDVPLDTYRAWENGKGEPHKTPSMNEILERMKRFLVDSRP